MDSELPSSNADNQTSTNNDGKEISLKLRISTNHVDGTPRIVANNNSSSSHMSSPSKTNLVNKDKEKNGVVKSSTHQENKKDSNKPNSQSTHGNHHHHHHHNKDGKNHSSPIKSPTSSKFKDSKDNPASPSIKDVKLKENSLSSKSKVDLGEKVSMKDVSGGINCNSSVSKLKVSSSSTPKGLSSSDTDKSSGKPKVVGSSKPKEGSTTVVKTKDNDMKPKEASNKPKDVSGKPKEVSSNKDNLSKSKDSSSNSKHSMSSSNSKQGHSIAATNNSHHKQKDSSSKEISKSSSSSSANSMTKLSSDKKISSSSSTLKNSRDKNLKSTDDFRTKKPDASKSKEKNSSNTVKENQSISKDGKEKLKDIKAKVSESSATVKIKEETKVKEEKKSSPTIPKIKKEPMTTDDDDVPLVERKSSSQRESRKPTKRPIVESDDDDDEPLNSRLKQSKQIKKEVHSTPAKSSTNKKRKTKDDYSSDDEPISKKIKKDNKVSKTTSSSAASSPTKRKKKQEEEQEVWKWWEEEKLDGGVKWKTLEHKGPVFAPAYERLPDSVKFYYNGDLMKLSNDTEEVATFYSKLLDHDYTTKEAFNHNFFKDWRKVMTSKEREIIVDLKRCDFRKMNAYFLQKTEERKAMTKEQKAVIKKENEEITKEYGFCIIDGHKEKIGNFKIEPPGLFRGRGEHPKMGRLKKRTLPSDVIINCSKDSKIPSPPKGHKWKEVRHDNAVTWLACWQENIQGQTKYVMLNPSSKLKGEKDWHKYEVARRLKGCVDKIRSTYQRDFRSKEMKVRQRAVALYFIDQLALRAGNEKEEGETADTVGCCSLRVEHITLDDEKDGKQYVVSFDFLGKDSIRYVNSVPVEKRVYKNLHIFMENKQPGDDLFDRLNTAVLNKHLNELMEGLTAKVFRTFNASKTLQEQLIRLTDASDPIAAKMLSYNRANRAVAILCNHQRAVPKTFDKSMENLQTKIKAKRDVVKEAEKEYKQAKKAKDKGLIEKKSKALHRLKEQLEKLELSATDKEENKQIALGTSKLNYLDPRITVAWCKKHEVPIEKVYNRTQRDKFRWAIEMAGPDFVF